MNPGKFRLGALLQLREWERKEAAQGLAKARDARDQADRTFQARNRQRDDTAGAIRAVRAGRVAAAQQAGFLAHLGDCEEQAEAARNWREQAESVETEKREILRRAREREHILEKLAEKQRQSLRRWLLLKEDREREDLACRKPFKPEKRS